MAGLLDSIKDLAKQQYAKGAPYREAVGGLLEGDMNKVNQALSKSELTPTDFAMSFAPLGITAFHGSPYNFEKFSLEKIGAGEGKQVKGYGSYLASASPIAQQYAEANTGRAKALSGDIDKFPLSTQVDVYKLLNSKLPKSMKDARLEELSKKLSPEQTNFLKENINSGYMYKVDLPDDKLPYMLNLDLPLSKQSKEVQDILNKNNFNEIARSITNREPTGESLYRALGDNVNATNTLKNAGISGNSYLDIEAKRRGLNPTNYVVFDPSILNILEKNKL
jgi:hypothetical protein